MVPASQYGENSKEVVDIDRRHCLPYQDFVRDYLFPKKAVIISGALPAWRALGTWTPNYFKQKYGTRNVSVDGQKYKMADFIDRVTSSTAEKPAP